MNSIKQRTIYERTNIIPIIHNSPTIKKEQNEYSLTQNMFDPSKSSPPNDFMLKLQMRISQHNSFNNLDNLTRE
jgi:hypothetical protein